MQTALLVLAALTAGLPAFASSSLRPEFVLGAPPREAAPSSDVSAAASPRELFAVWNDKTTGESYGTAIGADGVPKSLWGVRISSMRVSDRDAVAWTGESYVVALRSCPPGSLWCTGSTMLVDADGTTRREPVPFGPADVPIVKANGSRVLLISDADHISESPSGNAIFFLSSDGKTTLVKALSHSVGQCVALATSDGFVVYVFENGLDKPTGVVRRLHIDNSGVVTEAAVATLPVATRIAAATNGSDELLVWSLAVDVGTMNGIEGAVHLTTVCEAIDSSGRVKGLPVPISDSIMKWYTDVNTPPVVAAPTVAWDNSRFLVGYVDYDGTRSSLEVTAVSPDGKPVAGTAAIADQAPYDPRLSVMASTLTPFQGRQFLFWSCSRGPSSWPAFTATYLRAFDDLASIAARPAVELAGSPGAQSQPAVSTDGQAVAVAWSESPLKGRIMAQVLSSSGLSEAVTLNEAGTSGSMPGVASGGGIHLVAWTERDNLDSASFRIVARRLAADGRLLDPAPIFLDLKVDAPFYPVPVVWDGANFLIAWTASQGVAFVGRVSPQGARIDRSMLVPGSQYQSLYQYDVHLVRIGDAVLALYQSRIKNTSSPPAELKGVSIRDGLPGPSQLFTTIPQVPNYDGVLASWNGRRLAISWREPESDARRAVVMGQCFSPTGLPLTVPRRLLERAAYLNPPSHESFIPDASGWWLVARTDTQPSLVQKLDDDLNANGPSSEIAPGRKAVLDGVGVSVGGNIALVYSRLNDSSPEAPSQRLFMQWMLLHPRERAVRK